MLLTLREHSPSSLLHLLYTSNKAKYKHTKLSPRLSLTSRSLRTLQISLGTYICPYPPVYSNVIYTICILILKKRMIVGLHYFNFLSNV